MSSSNRDRRGKDVLTKGVLLDDPPRVGVALTWCATTPVRSGCPKGPYPDEIGERATPHVPQPIPAEKPSIATTLPTRRLK
jgi:hypothetical protein